VAAASPKLTQESDGTLRISRGSKGLIQAGLPGGLVIAAIPGVIAFLAAKSALHASTANGRPLLPLIYACVFAAAAGWVLFRLFEDAWRETQIDVTERDLQIRTRGLMGGRERTVLRGEVDDVGVIGWPRGARNKPVRFSVKLFTTTGAPIILLNDLTSADAYDLQHQIRAAMKIGVD